MPYREADESLPDLVPLAGLPPERRREVLEHAETRQFRRGDQLFRQGDRDELVLYLLRGQIALYADDRPVKRVSAGSDEARYALAHLQPRPYTAQAESEVTVLCLDRRTLERMIADPASSAQRGNPVEVGDLEATESADWMTRLLKSALFSRVPAVSLQRLFTAVERVEVERGQVVVRQGEPGDYFYVVVTGRCRVSRRTASGSVVALADLGEGDSFGEEALIGDAPRNATVTMVSDGRLMRLSREEFVEIIRKPALAQISRREADELARHGAVWVDVRFPDEHRAHGIAGSLNLPLNALRLHAGRLDPHRTYLIYCDDGRRSAVGAFLLTQRSLDARHLAGGIGPAPPAAADDQEPVTETLAVEAPPRAPAPTEPLTSPSLPEFAVRPPPPPPPAVTESPPLRALAGQLERRLTEEQSARRAEIARHRDEMGRLRSLLELGETRLREARDRHTTEVGRLQARIEELQQLNREHAAALVRERELYQLEVARYEERISAAAAHQAAARDAELAALGRRLAEESTRREADLADHARSLAEAEARSRALEAELDRLRERQTRVEADADALRLLSERTEGELARTRERLRQTESELTAASARLQGTLAEIAGLNERLEHSEAGQAGLREGLARSEIELERWRSAAEEAQRRVGEEARARAEAERRLTAQTDQTTQSRRRSEQDLLAREEVERRLQEEMEVRERLGRERETALQADRDRLAAALAAAREEVAAAREDLAEALRQQEAAVRLAEQAVIAPTGAGSPEEPDEGRERALVPRALREALQREREALEHRRRQGNT